MVSAALSQGKIDSPWTKLSRSEWLLRPHYGYTAGLCSFAIGGRESGHHAFSKSNSRRAWTTSLQARQSFGYDPAARFKMGRDRLGNRV